MAAVKLEYKLTEEDLVAFNIYHIAHSSLHRSEQHKARVIPSALLAAFGAAMYALDRATILLVIYVALGVAWYLLCPRYLASRYRRNVRKHVGEISSDLVKAPVVLEPRDDGIYGSSFTGETKYNYAAVGEIVEDGGYTFVFLGKGMAFILPHDRVPKQDIDVFVAEIERHRADGVHTAAD